MTILDKQVLQFIFIMVYLFLCVASADSPAGPAEEPILAVTAESHENPYIPADAQAQYMPGEVSPEVVVVRNLPPTPVPADVMLSQPKSHIQGEFLDYQEAGKAGSDLSSSFEKPPPPKVPVPMIMEGNAPYSPVQPAASGDPVRQWAGIPDTGWIPPDTIGAVGPNHVVEAVNSGFAIYTKTGTEVQGYTSFDTFLHTPTGWQGRIFDPRVIYDIFSRHFIMLVLGKDDTNMESYYWIAISHTSDPTGDWWRWRFEATDNTGSSTAWLDYAGLGADPWGVYVTGDYQYFSGGFRGSHLRAFNPAMLTGGDSASWIFIDLKWPSGAKASILQPAHPHSINSNKETFFVNTHPGSGSKVCLRKLSGPWSETISRPHTRVAIDTRRYNAIGENVGQPGSIDLDGFDARVMNAVYADKRVFFTLTDNVNNDGKASGWLTVKLNTDNNSNEWQDLAWTGEGTYLFYPAVTLQGQFANNKLAVFGTYTDTINNIYASGSFLIYNNQPTDNSGPLKYFDVGHGPYSSLDTDGRNRWGDYSGAGYDWECNHAWGFTQSANIDNTWRTSIMSIKFGNEPACPN